MNWRTWLTPEQTRELGRCGWIDDNFAPLSCQRPAGHQGEHCGNSSSLCDYDDHNDACDCSEPMPERGSGWSRRGRCRCGGFVR